MGLHALPRGATIPYLLVVDPDRSALVAARAALESAGHEVRSAETGGHALALARDEPPELVVTELLLPDLSGLSFCRAVREEPRLARVPVLVLSASTAEMDRVVAFEIGADDFVSKPFHARELALRIRAILRRTRRALPEPVGDTLRHDRLELLPSQHQVQVDGRGVPLTAREFEVLAALMRSAGRVLSRRQLLERVWGSDSGKSPRVVDTHVKWIRRKLGPAADYIETLRGVGYRFRDTPARTSREGVRPVAPTALDQAG